MLTLTRCWDCREDKAAVATIKGRKVCTDCQKRCNFCHEVFDTIFRSRDGRKLCGPCAINNHMCEVCGSLPNNGSISTQPHFEEECFK